MCRGRVGWGYELTAAYGAEEVTGIDKVCQALICAYSEGKAVW